MVISEGSATCWPSCHSTPLEMGGLDLCLVDGGHPDPFAADLVLQQGSPPPGIPGPSIPPPARPGICGDQQRSALGCDCGFGGVAASRVLTSGVVRGGRFRSRPVLVSGGVVCMTASTSPMASTSTATRWWAATSGRSSCRRVST